MKPKNPYSRRRKIILYYSLAVVLPGIILGYMSFRGIRNDQAFREKERIKKLDSYSQDFFSAIDLHLTEFIDEQTADTIMPRSGALDPCILALFVIDTNGTIKVLNHKLLYVPAELLPVQPEKMSPPSSLAAGQQLEFIDNNYFEALSFYQDIARKTTDPAEKNLALVAVARLFKKLNQPERAKIAYEKILQDHPGCLLNGQIPLGLSACLEILKINQDLADEDDMRTCSLKYLELLIHPACEYDKNQFDLFYLASREFIPETDPVFDSLYRELDMQKVHTDYLTRILLGQNLDVSTVKTQLDEQREDTVRIPLNSNELAGLYFSWNLTEDYQTGIIIDFPVYLRSIGDELIQAIDPDSEIDLIIKDYNDRLVYSRSETGKTDHISYTFPESFPQLNLLLKVNKPNFLNTLFTAGSGIYYGVLVLITLLLVLGFVFTLYTLNQELLLNKLKSEFVSNVSHELKSPLTSIRMMLEMLHLKRVPSEERKAQYYSTMLDETEHLSHLIENILDFSRIEDKRKVYHFADLDLNDLLTKFIEDFRKRLTDPGFKIHYESPGMVPVIQGDKDALVQVFYNLVDNAIKYSGKSKKVDVKLAAANEGLLVYVRDYGMGISLKDQEKIFERFFRSDESHLRGVKGSGIGLTIVKRIIDTHKGNVTIESRPGKGSTFCVYLPFNKNMEP